MKMLTPSTLIASLTIALSLTAYAQTGDAAIESRESLGEKLFNDPSLSRDGTQSCASCHDSQHAFIDPRVNQTSIDSVTPGAVSTGQDGTSLGDINTPSAAYAAFVPDFHFDQKEGLYKGGLFFNGRAANLVEQAKQPFLNPLEMQSSKQAVIATVREKYGNAMHSLYGKKIFDSDETAFNAIAESIAAFQRTNPFAPFDSKFDRVLNGKAKFTATEKRGLDLFVAEDKGNCAACHPVPEAGSPKADRLFTDFTYDNLGVPKNTRARAHNGKGKTYVDDGLFNHPAVNDPSLKGAFRVSGLRNISVTPPYMHNGVFRDLETVVHFYNSRDVQGALNPETGAPWRAAEIDATKNVEELGKLGLSEDEVNAIVAFLKTLTDESYVNLIPQARQ